MERDGRVGVSIKPSKITQVTIPRNCEVMKGPGKDRERARATQCFHSASPHEPTSHGAESRARADEACALYPECPVRLAT